MNENQENDVFVFEIRIGVMDIENQRVNHSILYSGTDKIKAEQIAKEAMNNTEFDVIDFNWDF